MRISECNFCLSCVSISLVCESLYVLIDLNFILCSELPDGFLSISGYVRTENHTACNTWCMFSLQCIIYVETPNLTGYHHQHRVLLQANEVAQI